MKQGKIRETEAMRAPDSARTDRGFHQPSRHLTGEDRDALIHPTREPGEEPVTPTVILTFTQPDYQALCRLAQAQAPPRQLWGCAYRAGTWEGTSLTVVAPALGAPYAAMILEKLIALGARRVLVLGWCGSVSPEVRLGDLILPTRAVPGDGNPVHGCLCSGNRQPDSVLPGPGRFGVRPGVGGPLCRGPVPGNRGGGSAGGFRRAFHLYLAAGAGGPALPPGPASGSASGAGGGGRG
ncbi:MAG: hypothetical protein P8X58_15320 [Syntrophobacterales bacterium]